MTLGAGAGCGPVGAVGDIVARDQKSNERQALAEKIRRHWLATDPQRFGDLKASVSYSNDWQKFFLPQYTLIVTGSVQDDRDRELAIVLAREALGVGSSRIYVTNEIRVARKAT